MFRSSVLSAAFSVELKLVTIFQVGGAPKYKCHICDKVFSWCYTLTLHLRKKHELKWPSGHSRFRFVAAECHNYLTVHKKALKVLVLNLLHRYKKDVDGFLKVNMVRFETVEVTKEIMKNMGKKPPSLRKSHGSSIQNKRGAATPESSQSSPAGLSSPSSSSCSSDSSDMSSQPSPRGGDSPTYCVMSTIPHMEEEPEELTQDDCDDNHMSGAVQALTEVARGLGMDVS